MNSKNNERKIIEEFLELKFSDRFTALTTILKKHDIDYEVESGVDNCKNIIVSMTKEKEYILFVAHYDVYVGSTGINDNTAAIATLINVITTLKNKRKSKIPFKILFSDQEETGMGGSRDYVTKHFSELLSVIVLDIVGYGDRLVAGSKRNDLFSFLENYDITNTETILPSDNLVFGSYGIPTTLIVATHDEDIHVRENGAFLTYSLSSNPKFYESFHNRAMDNKLEVINFKLLEHLRKSIIQILGFKL